MWGRLGTAPVFHDYSARRILFGAVAIALLLPYSPLTCEVLRVLHPMNVSNALWRVWNPPPRPLDRA